MKEHEAVEDQRHKQGQPDFAIMIITFILVGLGLVMVYSASQITAYMDYEDSSFFVKRQLVWAVVGIFLMYITMNIPYRYYRKWIPVLLLVLLVMMVLVPTGLGESRGGAQRWLNLGGFVTVQPSEFVKIGLIIYLASIYSKKQEYMDQFTRGVLPPLCIVGLFFGLILLQRDLGTAMSLILFTMVILFCSGARFKHLFGLGLTSGVLFAIFAFSEEYRLERLTSFRDPWSDPGDDGYQLIQSLYAIGNGGLTGSGFGNSIQKYLYLPEAHTDFIFAIVAEELGLIGVTIILALYICLILRGIKVSTDAPDTFGTLLGIGIVSMIGIQIFINIGVASGLLPVTGLALPFLSYGGSSLLLTMISIGILLNISRYTKA